MITNQSMKTVARVEPTKLTWVPSEKLCVISLRRDILTALKLALQSLELM